MWADCNNFATLLLLDKIYSYTFAQQDFPTIVGERDRERERERARASNSDGLQPKSDDLQPIVNILARVRDEGLKNQR